LTSDGYYLSLQNIPRGISGKPATKGVVFYQHGLTDSAIGAVLNPPAESFPFILADAGYDVWLGNNRGNGVSMKNTKYNPSQAEFWQFTWDDMALTDFPTNIDFILKQTGASRLTYIGHSEGTIQAFAGLIANPSLADKLNLYIALAPVAYVYHTGSLLCKALADLDTAAILTILGDHEFYLPKAVHSLLPDICRVDPSFCAFDLDLLMGPSTNLNVSRIAYYLSEEPNPTSVMNMVHWSQVKSTHFSFNCNVLFKILIIFFHPREFHPTNSKDLIMAVQEICNTTDSLHLLNMISPSFPLIFL
jgi:pimeloyl-ACP methyl ester carboxylesterase